MAENITDFLTTTTYKDNIVVDVFKKIDIPDYVFLINYYDEYIIKEGDRWDRLSFNFYGTPHLWWLLASYNGVIDPFTSLVAGEKLKIIKSEIIPNLLMRMKGILK